MESQAWTERFRMGPTGDGSLQGLTFGVKDNIDLAGHPTGSGNPAWLASAPDTVAHAPVVETVLAEGAECVGKLVMDELAFSLVGENAHYGTPLNPMAPDRVPGGSSSGPASAVACGECDFALGTDTGGSVRIPASHCGLYGFRPSHGIISVAGVVPLAPTFDTVGILARDFEVLRIVASVLEGIRGQGFPKQIGRILLPREIWDLVDDEVRAALEPIAQRSASELGTPTEKFSLSSIDAGEGGADMEGWRTTYCQIQWAEAWSCLGSWIESKTPDFGEQIAATFELARKADRAHFHRFAGRREQWAEGLARTVHGGTILCYPTSPTIAPLKGSIGHDRSNSTFYARALPIGSIAGIGRLPQVSLPLGSIRGNPIGLSFTGARGSDIWLLERLTALGSLDGKG